MLYPSSLTAQVPVQHHMRALARQHPQVVRMAVRTVLVPMMHNLTGLEWSTEVPLGNGAVDVIGFARPRIAALGIAAHE